MSNFQFHLQNNQHPTMKSKFLVCQITSFQVCLQCTRMKCIDFTANFHPASLLLSRGEISLNVCATSPTGCRGDQLRPLDKKFKYCIGRLVNVSLQSIICKYAATLIQQREVVWQKWCFMHARLYGKLRSFAGNCKS